MLDGAGVPLPGAALWNDTTSADDAAALVEDLGGRAAWAARAGSVPLASFTVAKWAHLRRTQPDVAAAAAAVRLPHDFLTERLCGRAVTDRGDASGTGWWSPAEGAYADDVLALERVGLDRALLPEVLTGAAPAGSLTTARGAGARPARRDRRRRRHGRQHGRRGRPGPRARHAGHQPGHVRARPTRSPSAGGRPDRRRWRGSPTPPSASSRSPARSTPRSRSTAIAAWLELDRDAVEPAGEVVVLPYLDGERTPDLPHAAGTITGLRHDDDRRADPPGRLRRRARLAARRLDALEAATGALDPAAPLVLVGGGARGATWRASAARLSGRDVEIPDETDSVAVGAAALAAAALEGASDGAALARGWDTRRGTRLGAPARDDARLERMRSVAARLAELNAAG